MNLLRSRYRAGQKAETRATRPVKTDSHCAPALKSFLAERRRPRRSRDRCFKPTNRSLGSPGSSFLSECIWNCHARSFFSGVNESSAIPLFLDCRNVLSEFRRRRVIFRLPSLILLMFFTFLLISHFENASWRL